MQLGYNAEADPILFIPEVVDSMFAIPEKGWKTSLETLSNVQQLQVPMTKRDTLPPQ